MNIVKHKLGGGGNTFRGGTAILSESLKHEAKGIRTELILEEVPGENPIGLRWRGPQQRDGVPLDIRDPENRISLRGCGGKEGDAHTVSSQTSCNQLSLAIIRLPPPPSVVVDQSTPVPSFHNPTSLRGFELEGVAAGAVAPPVEGHDDEAVL